MDSKTVEIKHMGSRVRSWNGPQWETCYIDMVVDGAVVTMWEPESLASHKAFNYLKSMIEAEYLPKVFTLKASFNTEKKTVSRPKLAATPEMVIPLNV